MPFLVSDLLSLFSSLNSLITLGNKSNIFIILNASSFTVSPPIISFKLKNTRNIDENSPDWFKTWNHENILVDITSDDDKFAIEKENNKSIIVTAFNEYTTTKSLDTLLDELPNNFRKCHRSYILNENKVISIDKKLKYAYFNKTLKCPINSHFELN